MAARGRRGGVPELQVFPVGEPAEAPLPPLRPHLLLRLRHQDGGERAHRQARQGLRRLPHAARAELGALLLHRGAAQLNCLERTLQTFVIRLGIGICDARFT